MHFARRLGLVAAVLVSLGGSASAQESHKFNAKAIEAKFSMPVFPTKGGVVANEVIETNNETDRLKTAIWSVKAGELKKAVDFYTKALGVEPTKELTDDGSEKYTFKKPEDGATRHRVTLLHDKVAKQVQIQLWMRTYESAADAE